MSGGKVSHFTGKLRPFQEEAVDLAWDRGRLLVAYEMGLGKTVVTIAAIEDMWETNYVKAGLIVVPASLKYQWAQKICEFTGGEFDPTKGWRGGRLENDVAVIDGTPAQRKAQYAAIRENPPLYTILNYEKVRDEWAQVCRLRRDFVVADEATVFKGSGSLISKRMRRLQPENGTFLGLTGQPIEKRPEDLYNIMLALDDTVLTSRPDFFDKMFVVRDPYGRIERVKNLPQLWDLMGDAMVRKTRHDPDVAPFMPRVEDVVVPVQMDRTTAKVYNQIVAELLSDLAIAAQSGERFDVFAHYAGETSGSELQGAIMSKLTCLRMLCDHPDLIRLSAQLYDDPDVQMGSAYAASLVDRGLMAKVTKTPKMSGFLDKLLLDLDTGPKTKVVVFSTFKPTLSWLRDALAAKKIQSVLFTGDMNARQKDAAKFKFQADPRVRVFLSSDAGGYGVDLPNANYLKNYDLPNSSGKWDQRNARIIRLSSEFDKVHLEHYVIEGSYEERQHEALRQETAIANAMVDRQGADAKGGYTLGLQSLSKFLQNNSV